MRRLSITGRARLLTALLTAALMVALVQLAQGRIGQVLHDAVDSALRTQATAFDERGPRGRPPDGGERRASDGDLLRMLADDRGPGPGRPGDHGPNRREPPPIHFGAASLLPPRRLSLERGVTDEGKSPWSADGFAATRGGGEDLRDETDPDTGVVRRVYSVRRGDRVLQAAATLAETDAALAAIRTALYGLLVPLALLGAVLGAALTEVALAPLRQLTRAASRLDPNHLGERLPAPGGGDTFDQLVQVLNAMLGRLDGAFARQKRFTADASHELRTPLAVVKATTSLLLENPESLTAPQRRGLLRIDRTADRANTLIADLLQLARSENGALTARRTETNLAALLDEAIDEARISGPNPSASVQVDCPADLTAPLDPDLIHRLIVNLVGNALRHTPPDGQVRVRAAGDGARVRLEVVDTGEGVSADALARLGEPFFRPDEARAREGGGAGLGLALCRAIAHAHGGALRLDSRPGDGLRAEVDLPATASGA